MTNRLKELRNEKEMSQKELANYLNIPILSYVRYECNVNVIPTDILIKLADFYHVSLDYLVKRSNEKVIA